MSLGDFTDQADSYRRSRPSYPMELLDALIIDAGLSKGDPVADFGAGTGILTSMLIEKEFVVSAIEPNESMRNQALVPGAQWLNATFEESHLPDQSQRWAIAAQAFHWADPIHSLPEIRRILQEGCLFTILWNNRIKSENEIVRWSEEAIRRHVPEFDEAYRHRNWSAILESTGDFDFVNYRTVRHTIVMTRERFLELWKSHNRLNTIAGPERFSAFYRELESHLEDMRITQIEVCYECEAWSARRRS